MRYVYAVDDDAAVRDSLRWLLESSGFEVRVYPSAEAFLREYRCGSGLCLILDARLPSLSGPDLQRELRRRGDALPLIFLEKPVDAEQLLRAVETAGLALSAADR